MLRRTGDRYGRDDVVLAYARAFTRFVRAAVADDVVHVYGDGEQVRDFTVVDDVVAANLAAARGEGACTTAPVPTPA